jgi:hypothetical protein
MKNNLKKIISLFVMCALLIPFAQGLEEETSPDVRICFSSEENNMPTEAKNLMKTLISRSLQEYENQRQDTFNLTVFIEDSSPEEDFERCEGEKPQEKTIHESYATKYEDSEYCHYIIVFNLEENENRGFWFVRTGNCEKDQEIFSFEDVFSLEINEKIRRHLNYTWLEMDYVLESKEKKDNLNSAGLFEKALYFFRSLIDSIIKTTPKPLDIQKKCIEAFGEFPPTKASYDIEPAVEETLPKTVTQTRKREVDIPEIEGFVYESYLSYFLYEVPQYANTIYSTTLTTNHILETILLKTDDIPSSTPTQDEDEEDEVTPQEDSEEQERSQTETPTPDDAEIEERWLTIIGETYLYEEDGVQKVELPNHLHWPGGNSGVTIGIGYDMKMRSKTEVYNDLINAGMDEELADTISDGAELKGEAAENFVKNNEDITINDNIILNLFPVIYQEIKDSAYKRATSVNPAFYKWSDKTADGEDVEIALGVNARAMEIQDYVNENQDLFSELVLTKSDPEERYMEYQYWLQNEDNLNSTVDVGKYVISEELWNSLHPVIIEFITDLRYQGGTYGNERLAKVNRAIITNDNTLNRLKALVKLFTPQKDERYSFFDQYLISKELHPSSAENQFYFCKDVSWNDKIRRNIIRKTFLECIIDDLENGNEITLTFPLIDSGDRAEEVFDNLITIINEQLEKAETEQNYFFTIRIHYDKVKDRLGDYEILFEEDGLKLVSEDGTIVKKEDNYLFEGDHETTKIEIENYDTEQCGLNEYCIRPKENLQLGSREPTSPLFNFTEWYEVDHLEKTDNTCEEDST